MEILKKTINNVPVTIIKTDKFKSVAGRLYFKSPVTREKMTSRAVLRNIILDSCKKYDTSEKLYRKALEKYDAYLASGSQRVGNYYINSFSFSTLIDKYTKKGNLSEVVDLFCEIIFNPLVKDNSFDEEIFNIVLNSAKNALEKVKEESSSYAERMTLKKLNQDKPYTFVMEEEYLDKLTKENLYLDYKDMIENSEVELFLAGDIDFSCPFIEKIVNNVKFNKKYDKELFVKNDLEKTNKKVIKEKGMGTQNIINMVMYLKNLNEFELNYVAPLYRMILGGGAFSRLFLKIREENSLSYYSFARYEKDDALMYIIMGIEKENFDKAYSLTLDIVNSMKDIKEEELELAKKVFITNLKESQDMILNVIGTYHIGSMCNMEDKEEIIKNINKVQTSDIENLTSKIEPSLCYFLEGE